MNNKKIAGLIQKQIYAELLREFRRVSSPGDLNDFFNKFMTSGEKQNFLRRLAIIKLIRQNKKYREIQELLGLSRDTISKSKDIIAGRGYGRNPNRKRKYSPLVSPKKAKKRYGLKYKGAESILNIFDWPAF